MHETREHFRAKMSLWISGLIFVEFLLQRNARARFRLSFIHILISTAQAR